MSELSGSEADYTKVTEVSGDEVSKEQVARMCERYVWALKYCEGKSVLEVACGAGQGIGLLSGVASKFVAGDYSQELVDIAQNQYGERASVTQFDAQNMPFDDNVFDTIILFEAIYYIPDAVNFVKECQRLLRRGGHVLVATANKDLFDFNPSPHTHRYYGVVELGELFGSRGFECEFFAGTPVTKAGWREKILRPVKRMVVALNLMPKTMKGKKMLKRLVFGGLVQLPAEITKDEISRAGSPDPIASGVADKTHKVLYCAAKYTG
ncbi:MAG: class I SAM-dependent methyltransferase [Alphaproteobacteria bacterium]|nr:class I SAM-dependent methyltransferase [Alphaproteobacteria bacterium]